MAKHTAIGNRSFLACPMSKTIDVMVTLLPLSAAAFEWPSGAVEYFEIWEAPIQAVEQYRTETLVWPSSFSALVEFADSRGFQLDMSNYCDTSIEALPDDQLRLEVSFVRVRLPHTLAARETRVDELLDEDNIDESEPHEDCMRGPPVIFSINENNSISYKIDLQPLLLELREPDAELLEKRRREAASSVEKKLERFRRQQEPNPED